jgi:hypothetical protein
VINRITNPLIRIRDCKSRRAGNDCEINVFFLESNLKGFAVKKGDVLNIIFDKIDNRVLHCSTKLGDRNIQQRFKILPND